MTDPTPPLLAPLAEVLARLRAEPPGDLVAAVRADQSRRWRGGAGVPVEAYLEALPGLAGRGEDVLVLVSGELLLRQEQGDAAALDDCRRRFPGRLGASRANSGDPAGSSITAAEQRRKPPRRQESTCAR